MQFARQPLPLFERSCRRGPAVEARILDDERGLVGDRLDELALLRVRVDVDGVPQQQNAEGLAAVNHRREQDRIPRLVLEERADRRVARVVDSLAAEVSVVDGLHVAHRGPGRGAAARPVGVLERFREAFRQPRRPHHPQHRVRGVAGDHDRRLCRSGADHLLGYAIHQFLQFHFQREVGGYERQRFELLHPLLGLREQECVFDRRCGLPCHRPDEADFAVIRCVATQVEGFDGAEIPVAVAHRDDDHGFPVVPCHQLRQGREQRLAVHFHGEVLDHERLARAQGPPVGPWRALQDGRVHKFEEAVREAVPTAEEQVPFAVDCTHRCRYRRRRFNHALGDGIQRPRNRLFEVERGGDA